MAGCETTEGRLIIRYICNIHLIETNKQATVARIYGVKASEMPGHLFHALRIYSSLTCHGKISSIK